MIVIPMRPGLAGAASLIMLGLSLPAADAAPAFNAPADVGAITAMETDLATQTSMKGLIGDYAPDATVVDTYAPGLYKGHEQINQAFEQQFAPLRTLKHHMDDINIASDGTFACAAMRISFDFTLKNGTSGSMSLRQIDAFKKIDGGWKIIQQHIALPIDGKTGSAVMDGTLPARGPIAWSANPLPGPAVSPDQAKAEIRRWMEVGALSTSIDQLVRYYGPGDDLLIYDAFYPGEIRGRAELRRYYASIMGSYNSIEVKMPVFAADSDGSFGVQIDTQDMRLKMKDGSTKYISLRQSDCMRRIDGKWYSFFEMISFPVVAHTGKAIMENPSAFR